MNRTLDRQFVVSKSTRTPRGKRLGFTLLEVLVGMVLFAGLVASSLVATSRYQLTVKRLVDQQAAIEIADQLMHQWADSPHGVPAISLGVVPGSPRFRFRTRLLSRRLVCGVPVDVVRLEVWADDRVGAGLDVVPDQVLAQVDCLEPTERI